MGVFLQSSLDRILKKSRIGWCNPLAIGVEYHHSAIQTMAFGPKRSQSRRVRDATRPQKTPRGKRRVTCEALPGLLRLRGLPLRALHRGLGDSEHLRP